ncbi:MAG: AAA family ATPase [Chromatiaceae bacterium]|nr:AAA family ATPase [Chromatiaceae bacterium]
MYAKFYGLAVEPFSLSPDPRFCYRHPSFARAKAYFEYAIHRGEGFVVVTGRPGTGKTTLTQDLVRDLLQSSLLVARIDSTQVEADDLLRLVAYAFGIDARGADKASLLHDIEHLLRRRAGRQNRAILIVDEAQNLPPAALEELRLITNLHDEMAPLVQIFLVGQEELRTSIRHPSLEQLHQRIVAACHIEPLNPAEMRGYIQHRLLCGGWQGDPAICGQALGLIHVAARGIPRLVNKFCDRLLVHGSIEGRHILTVEDAHLVLAELRQEYLTPQDAPLGDLLRQGGAPDLADLGFDPAELPPPAPPAGAQGVSPELAGSAMPIADVSEVGPAEAPTAPRIEMPHPAPGARSAHRARHRWRWAAAAVLTLAAGAGYGLLGPARLGALADSARSSVERWLSAWEGASRPLAAGAADEGRPTGPVAELEVTPLVPLAPNHPVAQSSEATDPTGAGASLDSLFATAEPGEQGLVPGQTVTQRGAHDLAPQAEPSDGEGAEGRLAAPDAPVSRGTEGQSPVVDPPLGTAEEGPSEPQSVAEREPEPEATTSVGPLLPDAGGVALGGGASLSRAPPAREVPADPETSRARRSDLAALAETLAARGLGVATLEGDVLRLDLVAEVPFDVDSSSVPASSIPTLRALARALAEHPATQVRVIGHTDRSGALVHNRELSLRRAEAVVAQLAGEGIAPERLRAEGRGMGEPLLEADGTQVFLRRVELRVEPRAAQGPGTAANLQRVD